MKALTVRQPYAWAIAHGGKDVENRSSSIRYRGKLAIHAGLSWHKGGAVDERVVKAFAPWMTIRQLGNPIDPAEHSCCFQFGAVIAVANLTHCHADDWDSGCCDPWGDTTSWHWLLEDVRTLARPVECTGKQGLWTLPVEAEAEVRRQLEVAR